MEAGVGIELRPITDDNFDECVGLRLADEQAGFVDSNAYSIAEASVRPWMVARAVYWDEQMVGFAMYSQEPDPRDGRRWIHRLMIDRAHQRRGYGRATMREIVRLMSALPGCDEIMIGYLPHNHVAKRLYESVGFQELGLAPWGTEMMARYAVER